MYYVYVLKSLFNGELYFGYTSDLKKRVKEHNVGKSPSTKRYRPWKLIYYESYLSEEDAKDREKQLKHFAQAYTLLKKRIRRSIET